MKRAEAPRPRSREHLNALLAAKKLREPDDVRDATDAFPASWSAGGVES